MTRADALKQGAQLQIGKDMPEADFLRQLGEKGTDIDALLGQVFENPEGLRKLVEAVQAGRGTARYAYEKALRRISEQRPQLLYPHFDALAGLLEDENSFLKWGAIMTVANLTAVDTRKKFEAIFKKYYAPITGPVMVTAANIIASSAKIARAKPALVGDITREILKVERAEFTIRGNPSPECRNVAIGHAIDSFDQFFSQIEDKAVVIKFVKGQLGNTRKQVVKKAERFLNKYDALEKQRKSGKHSKA